MFQNTVKLGLWMMRSSTASVLHFCTDLHQGILQGPTFPGGIFLQFLVLTPLCRSLPSLGHVPEGQTQGAAVIQVSSYPSAVPV